MRTRRTAPKNHATPPRSISVADAGTPPVRVNRLLFAVLTLGIMLMLKRHYSLATADQLAWILAPTARLVAWFTPAHPVFEHGVGHVDFAQGIIIAPACAGINFMIMALGLAVCCGLTRFYRFRELAGWLVFSSSGAYAFTLAVNTLRIGMSIYLYRVDIYHGWLTPERLHRIAGAVLYLGALWLFYIGMNALAARFNSAMQHRCPPTAALPNWLPMVWYLVGTVGIPAVNLLVQPGSPKFIEHGLTLVAVSLVLWGSSSFLGRMRNRYRRRRPFPDHQFVSTGDMHVYRSPARRLLSHRRHLKKI